MGFVGRESALALLRRELELVARGGERPGRCVLLRGRRRVGKSRLVETFVEQAGVPAVFHTATGGDQADLARDVLASDLPGRTAFLDERPRTWAAAVRLVAAALPDDRPGIVVIDEFPLLTSAHPDLERALHRAWARYLSRKPVLLLLVGSDLPAMAALGEPGRPFHRDAVPMTLAPLDPAELAELLDLPAAEAIDAHLVTGGVPQICAEWPRGHTREEFLRESLASPTSAMVVCAQLGLATAHPAGTSERAVLDSVGSGARTFTAVGRGAAVSHATLNRSLVALVHDGVVAADKPLSIFPFKETRYRVDDPHLSLWLQLLEPGLGEIDRGRGDLAVARIERGWTGWRDRAVVPVVREALRRLGPAAAVGGYWTRSNDVDVDIVAADREPEAGRIEAVGSVVWAENRPFDAHDLATLAAGRARVHGAGDATPMLAVTRSGTAVDGLDRVLGADDLLAAWTPA